MLRSSNLIRKDDTFGVYKGVIDNAPVSLKNFFNDKSVQLENELIIQSHIIHKNIARLIGCCLEMDKPILVYGFLPRESLHDILHGESKMPLNLDVCLNIIAESAQGLAYLHSQARKVILHANFNSASILLDENFIPKISYFWMSRLIARDMPLRDCWILLGDMAYMDPVYLQTGVLTLKSDVYGFGVVILELISRKKPTYIDGVWLVQSFIEFHKQGKKATELFDKEIAVTRGDLELLDCLTEIAVECLNLDVDQRPSMTQVAERLLILNRSRRLHTLQISTDCSVDIDINNSFVQQQKVGHLSLRGVQDTSCRGADSSSPVSTGFYKLINLNIFNRRSRRNFARNRHTLRLSHFVKIFTKEELERMLRRSNFIREGDFQVVHSVYTDTIELVTVKKRNYDTEIQKEQFKNEVLIHSQVIHKNIVRLIGCCSEIERNTHMLVYEFLPRGSLDDILHGDRTVPLNLDMRLNIVAESAQGLAYLHSQAHNRILHGDVRPANILLDNNFIPKMAGFGLSCFITKEKQYNFFVSNAMTHMDPVYLQTGLLNLKSDVYSFGVVILEVISRKKSTHSDKNSLVRSFLEVHKEGKKATELFDRETAVTAADLELLDCLAEIAVECLNLDVDQRPTMTDVAERLLILNRSRRSQDV